MSDELTPPATWLVDERLESIELHLEQLGVSDGAKERFVEFWNIAGEAERERLYALGDVRMLEELAAQAEGEPIWPETDDDGNLVTAPGTGVEMNEIEATADGSFSPLTGDGTGTALPPVADLEMEQDFEALDIVEQSIEAVLAWVGDDPAKAQRALDAEMMMQEPRKTLTARLAKHASF